MQLLHELADPALGRRVSGGTACAVQVEQHLPRDARPGARTVFGKDQTRVCIGGGVGDRLVEARPNVESLHALALDGQRNARPCRGGHAHVLSRGPHARGHGISVSEMRERRADPAGDALLQPAALALAGLWPHSLFFVIYPLSLSNFDVGGVPEI